MSADNGTYVLQTAGPEFRIAHLQNIEMIYGDWDENTLEWTPNQDYIRESFKDSKVYTDLESAWDAAKAIDASHLISEYGTNLITDFSKLKYEDLINGKSEKEDTPRGN